MIIIKNGTLTDDSMVKLQEYMNGIEGEAGQHSFLLLEAEGAEPQVAFDEAQRPEVEIKDLASVLQKDELFQSYLENGRKKVQSAFQLPDLYTGYTTDFNRATAQTAQEVTEQQVFQPERRSLGWTLNSRLLNGYAFRYAEAYFKDPEISNPDDLVNVLTLCNAAGGFTPNDAREVAQDALGKVSEDYEGDWANRPLALANGAQGGDSLDAAVGEQIAKAAANHDDEIVAVLKEVRNLLKKPESGSIIKEAKRNGDVSKGWVTTEDGQHIFIGSDGKASGGSAAYEAYQSEGGGTGSSKDFSSPDSYTPQTFFGRSLQNRAKWLGYHEVKDLEQPRTSDEIIEHLAGRDDTKGSCASLALAYVGQEAGMDVEDFRGGDSRAYFADDQTIRNLQAFDGVEAMTITGKYDQTVGSQLLREMEPGKEYYFAVAEHAAITRVTEDGKAQYLELQKSMVTSPGWKDFGSNNSSIRQTLRERFGCTTTKQRSAMAIMYDTSQLTQETNRDELRYVLGYINTSTGSQRKG